MKKNKETLINNIGENLYLLDKKYLKLVNNFVNDLLQEQSSEQQKDRPRDFYCENKKENLEIKDDRENLDKLKIKVCEINSSKESRAIVDTLIDLFKKLENDNRK